MNAMIVPLRRYAQFSGRSRPREYWLFVLFLLIASILLSAIDYQFGYGLVDRSIDAGPYGYAARWSYFGGGPLLGLFSLLVLIPTLAVTIRRLHDSDHSGWWLLIGLIPLVGGIVILVFMIIGGTRGPNRFGTDPVDQPPV